MSANSRINTKKIASAALAGMMALGTVPAAAIAEEASSVETQSVSEVEDFQATGTKVTKATINGTEADSSSVTANGETKTIVPTEITTAGGTVITLTANTDGTYTGSDGWKYTVSGDTANKKVGTHTYSVTGTKGSERKTKSFTWTITAGSLTGVTAYNGDDTSNTTFTYNGDNQDVHFLLNGKTLTEGADYTVKYVVNGQAVSTGSETLVNAGSYTAVLTGQGDYAGVTAEVPITVNKLDLSTASVKIADTDSEDAPTLADVEVNGTKLAEGAKYTLVFKSGTTASGTTNVYGQDGSYTYTLTSTDTANITGSKDVTFNKVETLLTSVNWGNNANTVNLDDASPAYFDASKVAVSNGTSNLPTSSYTLNYEKLEDGNWVAASANDLRSAGSYRVSVSVNASSLNYQYGGVDGYFYVTVGHNTNKASAYVSYKGNLVGTGTTTGAIDVAYNGNNVADDVTVAVRTSTGATLTAGTDYEVAYYNANGEKVDSITDAGTYQIRVNLLNGWKYSDGSTTDVTTVTVDPAYVIAQVSYDGQLNYGSGHFFNHTGDAITPTIEFFAEDPDGDYVMDASGRIVEATSNTASTATRYSKVDVPASAYTVTYKNSSNQTVSSIVDNGTYTVSIVDAHSGDDADNYTVATTGDSSITVSDQRRFADVPNDEWYAQVISDAADKEYMNGYGNGFFGPEDTFTRGQAACVLYNYAQKNAASTTKTTDGASSPFSDVQDSEAYYYDAVTWAAHTGVVNGYGDGTFKPDQLVTREEFAAMLANYAQKVGNYTAASDSVLDSFADASNVDDWAKSSVAWAVANKVMGNGGFINPTAKIKRAETAAMIMNFANAMK